jgi:hypothetical protein
MFCCNCLFYITVYWIYVNFHALFLLVLPSVGFELIYSSLLRMSGNEYPNALAFLCSLRYFLAPSHSPFSVCSTCRSTQTETVRIRSEVYVLQGFSGISQDSLEQTVVISEL